jgi:hypothetical protein
MKKYAWSFISFFNNEMHMGIGWFDNEIEALVYALKWAGFEPEDSYESAQDVKVHAFDCDAMVGAIQIE